MSTNKNRRSPFAGVGWKAIALSLAIACGAPRTVAESKDATAVRGVASASPFTAAAVTSTDGKAVRLTWATTSARNVKIYAIDAAGRQGARTLVAAGGGAGVAIVGDLPAAPRWYFQFVTDRGASLVTADHSLHLQSVPNFRDLGGYRTSDGHWVKVGLIYRSDQLDALSDADLKTIEALRVRLFCDLRSDHERESGLDRLPPGAEALIANITPNTPAQPRTLRAADQAMLQKMLGDGKGVAMFERLAVTLVDSPDAQAGYHKLFDRLSDPQSLPGLFHCSAGKDRTGWAAAVLLTILGVPREVVIQDYLASNTYLAAKNARMETGLDPETVKFLDPVVSVRREYIERSFNEVDARYGSFDNYVRDGLHLDASTLAALRRNFLSE